MQRCTLFLGHLIGADGIKPDPAKSNVVQDWPRLTDLSQVRSFLGLLNIFENTFRAMPSWQTP